MFLDTIDERDITAVVVSEEGYRRLLIKHGFLYGKMDTATLFEALRTGVVGSLCGIQVRCEGDALRVFQDWARMSCKEPWVLKAGT